jgi:hypothetical protein
MNIAPKKFKPRSVLKLTQGTSVGSRGPADLPHPIKEGPCKTLVTNNGVNVMFELQLRPETHQADRPDHDRLTHNWGVPVIRKEKGNPCLEREQVLGRNELETKIFHNVLEKRGKVATQRLLSSKVNPMVEPRMDLTHTDSSAIVDMPFDPPHPHTLEVHSPDNREEVSPQIFVIGR